MYAAADYCTCVTWFLSCRNQGTGKNCIPANDGPAGPHCQGSKLGLCCDAAYQKDNCLTLVGATADNTCASFNSPSGPLSAFCCDEMDLPDCYFVKTASDCVVRQKPHSVPPQSLSILQQLPCTQAAISSTNTFLHNDHWQHLHICSSVDGSHSRIADCHNSTVQSNSTIQKSCSWAQIASGSASYSFTGFNRWTWCSDICRGIPICCAAHMWTLVAKVVVRTHISCW